MKQEQNTRPLLVIGGSELGRQLRAFAEQRQQPIPIRHATLVTAWEAMLTEKPAVVLIEIGHLHNQQAQRILRKLLHSIRDRFEDSIYVATMITAPEKIGYAGDVLFAEDDDLTPSGWIDSFAAIAPGAFTELSPLPIQALHIWESAQRELQNRESGSIPLPALGVKGWAQSIADVDSRDLWMRWLPRYASYVNENPIIIGETGTGKSNLAYALHLLSGRGGNFVSITPRDFSSSELVQAELFGAVQGAYTGAVDKWGLVKSAENGTLFIDELQSIDKELQGKLITFIENKSYRRVGSSESITANVRFVFASNRSLDDMRQSEVLREDFAYRLDRVKLHLRPLRDRKLDIASGLGYALAKIWRQRPVSKQIVGCTAGAYRLLFAYSWPGNLRQLENVVAQLYELTDIHGHTTIAEESVLAVLPTSATAASRNSQEVLAGAATKLAVEALAMSQPSLQRAVEKLEELARAEALGVCVGNIEAAAALIADDSEAMRLVGASRAVKRELSEESL